MAPVWADFVCWSDIIIIIMLIAHLRGCRRRRQHHQQKEDGRHTVLLRNATKDSGGGGGSMKMSERGADNKRGVRSPLVNGSPAAEPLMPAARSSWQQPPLLTPIDAVSTSTCSTFKKPAAAASPAVWRHSPQLAGRRTITSSDNVAPSSTVSQEQWIGTPNRRCTITPLPESEVAWNLSFRLN